MGILSPLYAQESSPDRIKLFINCDRCDMNFIRQEIAYIDHVRDQGLANVQLQINDVRNATGGRTFDMIFIGREEFSDMKQELEYTTSTTDTNDDVRRGLVHYIETGLLPYLLETGQLESIQVNLREGSSAKQDYSTSVDRWNYWIFEVSGGGELEKESRRSGIDLNFGFEADRVTEEWRIRSDLRFGFNENEFTSDEEVIVSSRKFLQLEGDVVNSLGPHWSAGLSGRARHNTFDNVEVGYRIGPALEYSIFPYREVVRRELTVAYRFNYINNDYIETTVFEKDRESLFSHSLSVLLRFRQPWGDIFSRLRASQFLNDLSKNRFTLNSFVNVRIFRGLSVRANVELALIRDQITLPGGDASLEDLLLRQRQIATDFETEFGLGISYTFGSAFSNIINTRL